MSGPHPRTIRSARRPPDLRLEAVPSKSHAARLLVAASLAEGESLIEGLPAATDTRVLLEGLARLGARIREDGQGSARVRGLVPPLPAGPRRIEAGEAGTALRFLAACAALSPGPVTLDGSPRMRRRPVGPLCEALRGLGLSVADREGLPPLEVGGGPPRGGRVRVESSLSSQFASALLLIAPVLEEGLSLELPAPRVSSPYIELTSAAIARFGAEVERGDGGELRVPGTGYRPASLRVEGDWSSACFPLAAAAVTGGRVALRGLDPGSAQADRLFPELLSRMGVRVAWEGGTLVAEGRPLRGLEADLAAAPDSVPALAAVAALAPGKTVLRGVAHLRHKESDRLAALAGELGGLGVDVRELEDGLLVHGGGLRGGVVDPRGDHRIAMALALTGLAVPGVAVSDPGCVSKSYPGFWEDLTLFEGEGA
jgi:3-phosphoshikimate 1-carboxyvinyltransferase